MLRLDQVKIPVDPTRRREPWLPMDALWERAARILRVSRREIRSLAVARHAIDARRGSLFDVYALDVTLDPAAERRLLSLPAGRRRWSLSPGPSRPAFLPRGSEKLSARPLVAGTGPAGLFCGLMLARAGYAPILLERGDDTEARDACVSRFWSGGALDPESNIQFGAGGAGAYSDGKLTTGVRDPQGLGAEVLRILVEHGAPEDILTEAHPHVGTDVLKRVVASILREIRAAGGEVRFRVRLTDLALDRGGSLCGVSTTAGDLPAQLLVLAVGHSARDTLGMLFERGLSVEPKAFAVGFRVAHPQSLIDRAQYGMESGAVLPPAIYKLTARARDGRGVYSFCMCPGGQIVNASSEEGRLAVNGMSARARDGRYANSAIVVTVQPSDYDAGEDALDGMRFQRRLEERAYAAGEGRIPISPLAELARGLPGFRAADQPGATDHVRWDAGLGEAFCGGVREADLGEILPAPLTEALVEAMPAFGRRIRGFDGPEAILAGVESRTSSPVRLLRGESGESLSHEGIYPCGEGAGYAGGIVSAAMDGLRTAAHIIGRYAVPSSAHS